MEEFKDIIKESKDLIKKLYEEDNDETAPVLTPTTQQDRLRSSVIDFVEKRFRNITNQEKLKSLIEAEMAKMIATHQYSPSEIQSLYATVSKSIAESTQTTLDIFKPSAAAPSPLLNPPVDKPDDGEITKITPEERQAIHKLSLYYELLEKRRKDGQKIKKGTDNANAEDVSPTESE